MGAIRYSGACALREQRGSFLKQAVRDRRLMMNDDLVDAEEVELAIAGNDARFIDAGRNSDMQR